MLIEAGCSMELRNAAGRTAKDEARLGLKESAKAPHQPSEQGGQSVAFVDCLRLLDGMPQPDALLSAAGAPQPLDQFLPPGIARASEAAAAAMAKKKKKKKGVVSTLDVSSKIGSNLEAVESASGEHSDDDTASDIGDEPADPACNREGEPAAIDCSSNPAASAEVSSEYQLEESAPGSNCAAASVRSAACHTSSQPENCGPAAQIVASFEIGPGDGLRDSSVVSSAVNPVSEGRAKAGFYKNETDTSASTLLDQIHQNQNERPWSVVASSGKKAPRTTGGNSSRGIPPEALSRNGAKPSAVGPRSSANRAAQAPRTAGAAGFSSPLPSPSPSRPSAKVEASISGSAPSPAYLDGPPSVTSVPREDEGDDKFPLEAASGRGVTLWLPPSVLERMEEACPGACADLALQPAHLLGEGGHEEVREMLASYPSFLASFPSLAAGAGEDLDGLSMSQLDALEKMHLLSLARVNGVRLRLIRDQERQMAAEEARREVEMERRRMRQV